MTDTLGQDDAWGQLRQFLQRAGEFLGRVGFVVFLAAAVCAALVATTLIGLMLALAAVLLAVGHAIGRRSRSPRKKARSGGAVTLEARNTPDGWVIEPRGHG